MKSKIKLMAKGICLSAVMCSVIYVGVAFETIKIIIRRKNDKKTK